MASCSWFTLPTGSGEEERMSCSRQEVLTLSHLHCERFQSVMQRHHGLLYLIDFANVQD